MKIPGVIVDALKKSAVQAYGPTILKAALDAYDKKEITAEELIDGLRVMIEILDGAEALLKGKTK